MDNVLLALGFLLIAIVAFFVGRWHGMSNRSKELADALEQKEQELGDLKSNVNQHFSETARLFTNLTEEYKSLYQHLANGASELSDQQFQLQIAAPTVSQMITDSTESNAEPETDVAPITESTSEQAASSPSEEEVLVNEQQAAKDTDLQTENEQVEPAEQTQVTESHDEVQNEEVIQPLDFAQPNMDSETKEHSQPANSDK